MRQDAVFRVEWFSSIRFRPTDWNIQTEAAWTARAAMLRPRAAGTVQ